ncbi:hypothetical protein IPG41_06305 [Candidatus Peregrinibacteria bacterium]|nr:MAG: hypothetical protein IPG41_06305 [Candidatus Peregrinibacteria bacterium]
MNAIKKKWILHHNRNPNESLWTALMKAREIENPGVFFSSAKISDLHDPFLFQDMEKAVERLQKAIHARERIVVYGDYDVDGTSGAALLIHTLRMLGRNFLIECLIVAKKATVCTLIMWRNSRSKK